MIGSTPLAANAMIFALCWSFLALVLFMTLQRFVGKLLVAKLQMIWQTWEWVSPPGVKALLRHSPDTRWAAQRRPSLRPGYVKRCSLRFPHGNWGKWQSDHAGCRQQVERTETEKRKLLATNSIRLQRSFIMFGQITLNSFSRCLIYANFWFHTVRPPIGGWSRRRTWDDPFDTGIRESRVETKEGLVRAQDFGSISQIYKNKYVVVVGTKE